MGVFETTRQRDLRRDARPARGARAGLQTLRQGVQNQESPAALLEHVAIHPLPLWNEPGPEVGHDQRHRVARPVPRDPRRPCCVLAQVAEQFADSEFRSRHIGVGCRMPRQMRNDLPTQRLDPLRPGTDVGGQMEAEYRLATRLFDRLSPEQVADCLARLKKAIDGDFRVAEVAEDGLVLTKTASRSVMSFSAHRRCAG
jgi:hypothetical protein